MRVLALACAISLAVTSVSNAAQTSGAAANGWKMNATVIEACSCPMFCTCYFGSGHPAGSHDMNMNMGGHAEEHFCRFNNAYRVNKGTYKGVKLDGEVLEKADAVFPHPGVLQVGKRRFVRVK